MTRRKEPIHRWCLPHLLWASLPILAACEGPAGPAGPQGPEGPAGVAGCTGCHNAQTTLVRRTLEYEESKHWWGGNYVRGTSASCAGCHASEGFTARIAAGLQANEVAEGVSNPTPIGCRTCHQVHTTHTPDDWALRFREPVTLMASGATFDRGAANLCASCHQPRVAPPELGAGDVAVTARMDAHRTQAAVLLGVGAYGPSAGPGVHYMAIADSCVTCHLGPDRVHTKQARLAGCQGCHEGLTTFDRNQVQTQVQALYAELEQLLLANGILVGPGGLARAGTYPEEVAGAFWNYKFVYYDRSSGVHNPDYIRGLLQASIDALR